MNTEYCSTVVNFSSCSAWFILDITAARKSCSGAGRFIGRCRASSTSILLICCSTCCRHGFWGLGFCSLVLQNNISSYLVKVNFQMKIMAEAMSDGLFSPLCVWQVSPRMVGHTSQHGRESFPLTHKAIQFSKSFLCCLKLKSFPFVF